MRKMRSLSSFWVIIMFALFVLLGVYALYFINNEKYITLERNMVNIVKENNEYIDYLNGGNTYVVSDAELKKSIALKVDDDSCTGEVMIKKTIIGNIYIPTLICNNYKTFSIK